MVIWLKKGQMFRFRWLLVVASLVFISVSYAMPGPGSGPPGPPGGGGPPCWAPPCVPIDSALIVLLVGGAALGVKFLFKRR